MQQSAHPHSHPITLPTQDLTLKPTPIMITTTPHQQNTRLLTLPSPPYWQLPTIELNRPATNAHSARLNSHFLNSCWHACIHTCNSTTTKTNAGIAFSLWAHTRAYRCIYLQRVHILLLPASPRSRLAHFQSNKFFGKVANKSSSAAVAAIVTLSRWWACEVEQN